MKDSPLMRRLFVFLAQCLDLQIARDYGYAAVKFFRVSIEVPKMLNVIVSALITALQLLWRLLSRLMSLLAPGEFARVAQAELRSLDAALGGFLLTDPHMNWMRRSRPGLQPVMH